MPSTAFKKTPKVQAGGLKQKAIEHGLPITRQVEATMDNYNPRDPVARQYIPSDQENIISLNENGDPIGDNAHSPVKGIVHRYPDRALLKITDTCNVYCRFCFRKEMVGKGEGVLSAAELDNAFEYIQNTPQIREIILTGGDPLTLSNRRLQEVIARLEKIDHLDIIRFHTRSPIVNPKRIDGEFIQMINECQKAMYMVLHVNHAQEINDAIVDVFKKLSRTKMALLSQSVLLKGVNDNAEALENLFRALISHNVKPYYLHHLDHAPGTGHFRASMKLGRVLMNELQGKISGICLPTYVLDIPGGFGKIPINDCYVEETGDGHYIVKDIHGNKHHYSDL